MERLTKRNSEGIAVLKVPDECDRCGEPIYRLNDLGNREPIEKLAEYEDLEEQGLLPKFPCKIGDTLYFIGDECDICEEDYDHCQCYCKKDYKKKKVLATKAKQFRITEKGIRVTDTDAISYSREHNFHAKDFGKTVFLTQAKAEDALQKEYGNN